MTDVEIIAYVAFVPHSERLPVDSPRGHKPRGVLFVRCERQATDRERCERRVRNVLTGGGFESQNHGRTGPAWGLQIFTLHILG